MNSNTRTKHALALARHHFGIMAGSPGGKTPYASLAPHGAHSATRDPARIVEIFDVLAPGANVCATLSQHVVVDIDVHRGGDETLKQVELKYGAFPLTWRSLTGSGGEHIYLRRPIGADIRGGNDKLGQGIDIKTGAGSYVIAPPSRTTGRYEWRNGFHPCETPLAVAPRWLVDLLTPPPPLPPQPFRARTDDDERIARALMQIPADDRDTWWKIGAALKSHFGDAGRALWDRWSATSEKYDPRTQERIWRSFRRGGVTIATVFHLAKECARVA